MIVYVVSDKKMFGGRLDGESGMSFANDVQIYDGEHYLYRQEWRQDWQDQSHLNHEDFVKVVNDQWIKDHRNYYGCQVLDGVHQHDLATEYDGFLNEMENNY